MSKKEKFSLADVDFSKVKDDRGLMKIFVEFAFVNPKQGKQLFDKYVDFLCQKNPEMTKENAKKFAASDIGYMTGYYKHSTCKKLFDVYKMISHPIFGRYGRGI